MTDTTSSVPLLERTLELARNAPRRIKQKEMAKAIGVPTSWVCRFLSDSPPNNPRINHVQKLHDYLVSLNVGN